MTTPAPCTCTPHNKAAGTYAASCERHASWRCVVEGCTDPITEYHLCVRHVRRVVSRPLSPYGIGNDDGASDRECDRYERTVLGL